MKKTAKQTADVLLTVPEVSERLNCHPATIRRWIKSGTLKGSLLGGTVWRIPESEVERLIRDGQKPTHAAERSDDLFAEALAHAKAARDANNLDARR